jgi:hypothetical protein
MQNSWYSTGKLSEMNKELEIFQKFIIHKLRKL